MKMIKGLDQRLKGFDGKSTDKSQKIGEAISFVLYGSKTEKADEALRITQKIIPMIYASKNAIELEDKDFEITKKIIEKNEIKMPAGQLGQLLEVFENKKEDEPKETEKKEA